MAKNKFILKVNCDDEKGVVARITTPLYEAGCMIITLDQFADQDTKKFFMRICFDTDKEQKDLQDLLAPISKELKAPIQVIPKEKKTRAILLCSKPDHCMNDLLGKVKRGSMPVEIVGVASNHDTLRGLVEWHGHEFHHFPITKETKPEQEAKIADLFKKSGAELIILARYMQILSPEFCDQFAGQIINIHHSFLPSFKGASPYKQAYDRGVKIIGATAHYVTQDLDEGPIITQEVIRVKHSNSAKELSAYGADVECVALSKAVKYHAEHKVFINGKKTIVLK